MEIDQISSVSRQLKMSCEKIDSLADGVKNSPQLEEVYDSLMLDEVKHVQILALELTKLVANEGRADEGVFAEGDLNSTPGEEDDDDEE